MSKILLKMMPKLMRYKLFKKWHKNDQKWRGQNGSKIVKNWHAMGGSKMSKIDQIWPGGSGGGPFINFLKFCSFLQKLPHFSTPKSTPKMGPIKMPFPTNRLYFSQNGGPKMSLFGGSGGGPLGPKNVDTTI
jgi:hypothetical protein